MSSKLKVLLLGATGETGGDVLNGLIEDGSYDVSLLVQPSSAEKPAVKKFKEDGFKIVIGDISGDIDALVPLFSGIDILISTIGALGQLTQLNMVDAAAKAGIKRIVPCGFTTIAPPGGVMKLRDDKEVVHNRIFVHKLPYTIIDVGYWHQISFPSLPSGKVDYAVMPFSKKALQTIYGDGNTPTLLTDKRDIGRFVARILKDERTLNKRVFTYSDVLSQNQIVEIMEKASGEKIEMERVTAEEMNERAKNSWKILEAEGAKLSNYPLTLGTQYIHSKFIRGDNTPENAKYLGYIDATELYPDFKPIKFEEFVQELLAGKAVRPYAAMF